MKKLFEKKYFNLCYAIFLNLIFMAVCLCFIEQRYDMPDTANYPVYIAEGYYTFGFVSYFFCVICGAVQSIIYPINAYVVLQVVFSFYALTAVSFVYLQKYRLSFATFSIALLNSCYAVFQYTSISFNVYAALCGIAGILCIIHFSGKEKWILGSVVGTSLILICTFFRIEIAEVVIFIGVMYVIGLSLSEYFSKTNGDRGLKCFFFVLFEKKRFLLFMAALVLCGGLYFISDCICNSTDELKYYHEYTVARAAVWDYVLPEYEECREEYAALGLDKNDIGLFKSGYMDDEGATPLKVLKGMNDIKNKYNKENKSFTEVLARMKDAVSFNIRGRMEPVLGYFSFGLTLFLLLVFMRKNRYFIPLFLMAAIMPLLFYLHYIGRTPYRTVHVLWISALVYMLYSFSLEDMRPKLKKLFEKNGKKFTALILIAAVLMSPVVFWVSTITRYTINTYSDKDGTPELRKYIENSSKRFVLSRCSGLSSYKDNVHYIVKNEYKSKMAGFDGTYYRYTAYEDAKKEFGYTNLYKAVFDENVYFLDSSKGGDINRFAQYLQKHYSEGKEVKYEKITEIEGQTVYKFRRV